VVADLVAVSEVAVLEVVVPLVDGSSAQILIRKS
jgi:hypothetical protein